MRTLEMFDKLRKKRECGICNEQKIPFGMDWKIWKDGQPVCFECAAKLFSSSMPFMEFGDSTNFESEENHD